MSNGDSKRLLGSSGALNDWYKTNGVRVVHFCEGPSLTRQEFAEECDINTLMKRYEGHGGLNGLGADPNQQPSYVDFTEMPDTLLGFMQLMHDSEQAFMTLPAHIRREFDNNPVDFVDYASDPENLEQMRSWGLAKPLPEPVLKPVAEAPPASSSSPAAAAASPHTSST